MAAMRATLLPMTKPGAPRLLDLAVAALGRIHAGHSPRDALAEVAPRGLADEPRAALARAVYAVVQSQRRLSFVLGEAALDQLEPAARDAALLLAARVVRGESTPSEAATRWREWSPVLLPFQALLEPEPALSRLDPAARFAIEHSLPDWLAALLQDEFGTEAGRVATALAAEPPRTIRANLLRVRDRGELASRLATEGVVTQAGRFAPHALQVLGEVDLFALAAYGDGCFEQQDEGSQLVALAVAPPPRGKVLDACCGSGGKTLALAAVLQNRGVVLATDVHAGRLQELRQRARRAGAHAIETALLPAADWPPEVVAFARRADRILLDVPCTGLGALRRRPEARWRLQPTDLPALLQLQRTLLDRAAAALRPGARIVYATCSLLRVENEVQVEAALARHPGLELVRLAEILGRAVADPISDASGTFLSLRPDRTGTDGFFAAVLRARPR